MKQLEAFTLGKRIARPEANEDSLVVMPGLGYAVIDGVTDRNGTRYDGMLAGQFASRAVRHNLESFLLSRGNGAAQEYHGPQALVAELSAAIAQGYRDAGVYDEALRNGNIRAGCAVMLAFHLEDAIEIVHVGDSGIRVNEADVLQDLKPLDDVTSRLRSEAWRYFADRGFSKAECERFATSITWQGTRNQPAELPTAEPAAVAAIEQRAFEVNRSALPEVPEAELLKLIHDGIAFGQSEFQNSMDFALSYGVIDGFEVPPHHIHSRRLPLAEVDTLELFSDGYFKPGSGFGVAAWEAAFAEVEQEDPHKIEKYLSTKGTTEDMMTDDRTYIGVRLR